MARTSSRTAEAELLMRRMSCRDALLRSSFRTHRGQGAAPSPSGRSHITSRSDESRAGRVGMRRVR